MDVTIAPEPPTSPPIAVLQNPALALLATPLSVSTGAAPCGTSFDIACSESAQRVVRLIRHWTRRYSTDASNLSIHHRNLGGLLASRSNDSAKRTNARGSPARRDGPKYSVDSPGSRLTADPPERVVLVKLADFILANREPVLLEWEAFARTCAPASAAMDLTALRDHANEMLSVIAKDLETPQTKNEATEKSKGESPDDPRTTTAAEQHGAGRAESGFTVEQMVAEFRALRASVLRLWTKSKGALDAGDIDDLTRFNEAIDQSLAESVSRYTQDLDP